VKNSKINGVRKVVILIITDTIQNVCLLIYFSVFDQYSNNNEPPLSRTARHQTAYDVIPVEIERPSEIRIRRKYREQTDWILDASRSLAVSAREPLQPDRSRK